METPLSVAENHFQVIFATGFLVRTKPFTPKKKRKKEVDYFWKHQKSISDYDKEFDSSLCLAFPKVIPFAPGCALALRPRVSRKQTSITVTVMMHCLSPWHAAACLQHEDSLSFLGIWGVPPEAQIILVFRGLPQACWSSFFYR